MRNLEISQKKWKYVSIALMAILALGFSFPQAFAPMSDSVLTIVQDIQSKVNNTSYGLQAIKNAVNTKASQTSVNDLSTKVDSILAVRNISFNNELVELDNDEEQLILGDCSTSSGPGQPHCAYGFYIDLDVAGTDSDHRLSLLCKGNSGAGYSMPLQNGHNTLDRACTELDFFTLNPFLREGVSATVNGQILYTIEYFEEPTSS